MVKIVSNLGSIVRAATTNGSNTLTMVVSCPCCGLTTMRLPQNLGNDIADTLRVRCASTICQESRTKRMFLQMRPGADLYDAQVCVETEFSLELPVIHAALRVTQHQAAAF